MTKTEILTTVKNRIDETDEDTQIDSIIETAFDYCYRRDAGNLDKRLNQAFLPIVNGLATLPEDILNIEKLTPSLSGSDRRIGNSVITDKTGIFELIYSYVRPIPTDTEELDMDETLQYLIILYCCIAYYEYKKKNYIDNTDSETPFEECTADVYGTVGEE